MKKSSQDRYSLIDAYINKWLEYKKTNKVVIADKIVVKFFSLGLDCKLKNEGIFFQSTDTLNCDEPMRSNSQKLFRWLGYYDEKHKSIEKLLHIEPAIVAAMPNDLKMGYLNEVYAGSGVYIGVIQGDEPDLGGGGCLHQAAMSLTKENSEAQVDVIGLGVEPTYEQVEKARREIRESIGTSLGVLELIEQRFSVTVKKDRRQWAKTA